MKTIGHHACKRDGGHEFVLANGPFLSKIDENGKTPFLGEGLYYWDNNVIMAKNWGKSRCKDDYYILESELELKGRAFLDLVGNRSDMIEFTMLHDEFAQSHNNGKKWELGKFIEFLRELNSDAEYTGVFPWKVSRSIDIHKTRKLKHSKITFVKELPNYTSLSPCIVICLYEKKNIILHTKILA